ncbi:MAG: hypothetical protein JSU77_08645 [Fidelibacterota bacterium]|nr:MAG: hypothetical protein JSU77_08645 [Candidatus Neomarinimicrobiota bacterium]
MLAIAFSGHEVRYINWDRSGEDVRLIACQVIPWEREVDPFRDVARIREMIQRIIAEIRDDEATPVYLTLDAGLCHFSVMEIDPAWNAKEQLDFIQRTRFGSESLYASFQYPVESGAGSYLNVDCPTVLRRAVKSALPHIDSATHLLNIGVFSAYSYAKRVVPALERGRRLFWRASERGPDQFLEIQEGAFQALHFFERDASKVRPCTTVGDSRLQEPIVAFVEQLAEGQETSFPEVENVFVYLGSGDTGFLEHVLQVEQSALSLLNPFWRWNWPDVPEADNRFTQSAFSELADAVWVAEHV